jgi:Flp pilus assembly pilin Flp
MIVERVLKRFRRQRAGAQLIEEALLLSVALVALSLLVGGISSILKEAGGFTSNIWSSISSTLNNLFNSAFQW